jgi:HlyD family secretion protein
MKKIIFLLVAAGLFAGWWFYLRNPDGDAIKYQTTAITRGPVTQAVTATGTLNPVLKVQVGSQVSGIILKLFADYNSEVKSGQVIGELDPATYKANVSQAEAQLASAEAQLNLAELNARRQRDLTESKIGTRADLDGAEAALKQNQASVLITRAQLEKARVDLGRCTIYAPIDGIVISRIVDVGQTVAASLSAPVMFNIANDLRNMQIDASIAEADVGNIEAGQEVTFTVDAFQYRSFHGKVRMVRNDPQTVQNVVTYIANIDVNNDDLKLKPGMTANVSVVIAKRDDVVKLPNAALRFRPANAPATASAARTEGGAPGERRGPRTPGAGGGAADAGPAGGAAGAGDTTGAPRREGRGEGRGPGGGRRERGAPMPRNVYKLVDGKPVPVPVKLGISDGIFTEVLEGLAVDDQIITGAISPQVAQSAPTSNPFGGGSPGGGRRF